MLASAQDALLQGLLLFESKVIGPGDIPELLARFGSAPKPSAIRTLQRIADQEPEVAAVALALPPSDLNPAQRWLRAVALAHMGRPEESAAEVLLTVAPDEEPEVRALRHLFAANELILADGAASTTRSGWELKRAARSATTNRTLTAVDHLARKVARADALHTRRSVRLAVLGSVNVDLLSAQIRSACLGHDIDAQLWVGGIDQYTQEIVAPDDRLTRFQPEAVILLLDWRSLHLPVESEIPDEIVSDRVEQISELWRRIRSRWGALVVQVAFVPPANDAYASLGATLEGGRTRLIRRINLGLLSQATAGVSVVDAEALAAKVGMTAWDQPTHWLAAKQYPGPAAAPALAQHIAGVLRAELGLGVKCVALDLDNTLWGGVVGEDGITGIELGGSPTGEAFQEFQRYLRTLAQRGVPLAVCSKNDPGDARAPFLEHPEMVLRLDDISVFRANWDTKDKNLVAIANTLNIGTDALAFVDDNPVEREWIRQLMPEVEVIDLPSNPAEFCAALADSHCFEATRLTTEDRTRATSYRQDVSRRELGDSVKDVDAFIEGLGMTAELRDFREMDLVRLHQLVNKTNQFNLTTLRMTEADLRDVMSDRDVYTQSLRLRDRFGDLGLVGVLIGRATDTSLRIEVWLMSCRVLGRRVEEVMLGASARWARSRGLDTLVGEYRRTAKNGLVGDLYPRLGFALVGESATGLIFQAATSDVLARPSPAIEVVGEVSEVTLGRH
jgi:FkbH-like protein